MPNALLSVFEKAGIVEFARDLIALGWKIYASGGTARKLQENMLEVHDIAALVGGQAILGHRVVTLSRELAAALLARIPEDEKEMAELGLPVVDLVCVDMYPLAQAIAKPGVTQESVIDMTDIGGPTMLREAAKGNRIVVCNPADRARVIDWLKAGQPNRDEFINELAAEAEFTVSQYCYLSAQYRGQGKYHAVFGRKVADCCYGENRWQSPATLYSTGTDDPLALDKFERVQGSDPSYINMTDIDRLLQTITHIAAGFDFNQLEVPHIAVGCKHGNSCGEGINAACGEAIEKMASGDPLALFGGLVMTNFDITEEMAETMLTQGGKRVLDGVIAPRFDDGAVQALKRKNDRCRLFINPALVRLTKDSLDAEPIMRRVRGGFLTQPNYTYILNILHEKLEKSQNVDSAILADIIQAWGVCATSNSNTITLVKNGVLIGNGVGQQDRVGGCNLAISRAQRSGHDTNGAVACSDSFFPFRDGPETLAKAGIKTILTTSGSKNGDKETRAVCEEYDIALWMIPDEIGRGFFGH